LKFEGVALFKGLGIHSPREARYMTEDRELQIKKDLLWEYQQGQSKLEVFRVEFKKTAEIYSHFADLFHNRPEDFSPDLPVLMKELDKISAMAKEYKNLLEKNEERRVSLMKMHVL
jgi:hypothetical protein